MGSSGSPKIEDARRWCRRCAFGDIDVSIWARVCIRPRLAATDCRRIASTSMPTLVVTMEDETAPTLVVPLDLATLTMPEPDVKSPAAAT